MISWMYFLTILAAVIAHGPLLAYMSAASKNVTIGLVVIFFLLGGLLSVGWKRWIVSYPERRELLGMLALGNLGMLLGWMADFGWGPIIRGDLCLCGCFTSPLGLGILNPFSLMYLGMAVTSLPAIFYHKQAIQWGKHWRHFLYHLIAMSCGMFIGNLLAMQMGISNPRVNFAITSTLMTFGMVIGMLCVHLKYKR